MSDGPVLIVDDNPDDCILTVRALTKAHIVNEVIVAHSGADALERLFPSDERPPMAPAVILLDLKMPAIDGLEVLRRIRSDARTRLLPVVILTTSAEERDLVESYALGANSYVTKPVDFAQFIEAANLIGLYWLMLNRQAPVT